MSLSHQQRKHRPSQRLHLLHTLLHHGAASTLLRIGLHPSTRPSVCLSIPSPSQVRLLFAPPGLAGLEDDCSLSAVRLLFLFSASFPAPPPPAAPPPAAAPPSLPPPFSLSLSLSLSRVLLERSDIFTDELLPVKERWRCGQDHEEAADIPNCRPVKAGKFYGIKHRYRKKLLEKDDFF